jgi:hypothetical protein
MAEVRQRKAYSQHQKISGTCRWSAMAALRWFASVGAGLFPSPLVPLKMGKIGAEKLIDDATNTFLIRSSAPRQSHVCDSEQAKTGDRFGVCLTDTKAPTPPKTPQIGMGQAACLRLFHRWRSLLLSCFKRYFGAGTTMMNPPSRDAACDRRQSEQ